jgi:hypothetical protein
VFDSLVKITVGNGAKTLFWRDRWLRGSRIVDHVPGLVAKVNTQRRNNRTVMQALTNHRWILDLRGTLSMPEIGQCLLLLSLVSTFFRDTSLPDSFSWPCSPTGEYTARATYQRLCMGPERWAGARCVWRSWAPLKCKVFAWLALHSRLWTADRHFRFGLQATRSACFTCLQEEDSVQHIMAACVYSRQVWFGCLQRLELNLDTPQVAEPWQDWWLRVRAAFRTKERRGFDALVILVSWRLWRQRNARCFQNVNKQYSVHGLIEQILEDWRQWHRAGLGGSNTFARVVH